MAHDHDGEAEIVAEIVEGASDLAQNAGCFWPTISVLVFALAAWVTHLAGWR